MTDRARETGWLETWDGFAPPTSNTTYTPNQFFDVVLPHSSRGVVRLVAYLIRKTLGWSDAQGRPQEPRAYVPYREIARSAGVAESMLRAALDEAEAARFIICVLEGRAHGPGAPGRSGLYTLRWDESDAYVTDPDQFQGFYAGNGNLTYIPNDFFDKVVPREPLAVVKVTGVIIRHTIGWQTKFGFRRQEVALSFSALQRKTGIVSRRSLNDALQTALEHRHIVRREAGVFDPDAGKQSRPATYGIKWTDAFGTGAGAGKTAGEGNASKRIPGPSEEGRLEKDTGNASKRIPGERLEKRTGIEITKRNKTKKQQQEPGGLSSAAAAAVLPVSKELRESYRLLLSQGFDEAAARDLCTNPFAEPPKKTTVGPAERAERIRRQCAWIEGRAATGNRLGMLRRAIEQDWNNPEETAEKQASKRKAADADREKSRQGHQKRFWGDYLGYLGETLAQLETTQPDAFTAFLAYEARRRAALETGPAAASGVSRDLLAKFVNREQRLARFREFLNERQKAGERLPGVLSFWEWDGALNPGRFEAGGERRAA